MKFKYFLRGLGTGIIFTSIICLMAFQNGDSRNISDKEIIERAKELGLVEKKETVKDVFASEKSSEEMTEKKMTEEQKESEENTTKEKMSKEKTTEEKTTEEKSTEKKTTEKKTTEEKTTEKNTTEQSTTEAKDKTVTITIKGGSTSFPVCQKLQELGVIKDATDFDNYLIKNGYANRIRVGTHTLTIGMSYEEIAIAISDPM
ncbi:MAG: hypothetical protein J6C01_11125 [Lachnospiraceae bacterium]|nr:hypothetical protein [Lachnospiraceae bacterium]